MTLYDLDTEFTFGTYAGADLRTVALEDPAYISWCVEHVDDFFLSEFTLGELKSLNPAFELTSAAKRAHLRKADRFFMEEDTRIRPQDWEKHASEEDEGLLDDIF